MMDAGRKITLLAACLIVLASWQVPAVGRAAEASGARTALVVGNGAYAGELPALRNPVNDARLMARTLRALGFQVRLVENAHEDDLESAVVEFGDALRSRGQGGVGLFYYAGHGVQWQGANYLIPVGAEVGSERHLRTRTVSAELILEEMGDAPTALNIVVLDACRDNPWAASGKRSIGGRRGLTRMDVPTGPASSFFLAYSAAAGQAAEDGDGDNSRYTQALAAAMGTPGLELDDVFKEAGRQVAAATASRQVPWMEGSWYGKFFFAPPASRPAAKRDSPSLAGAAPDPATEMWLQIREIGDIRILERFLSEYPDSRYRLSAEARLAALRKAAPGGQDRLRDCGWCLELVEIPAGQFRMGDLAGAGEANEKPVRHVRVPRFALARHETTVRQFRRFVMATGYRTDAERDGGRGCKTMENATRNKWDWTPGRSWRSLEYALEEDQPVTCMNWNDARAYIEWLNEETGGGWRLPSEAEWEYAARAGSETLYHFGDDASRLCEYGNVADTTKLPNGHNWNNRAECADGAAYPTRVGRYLPNALGLHDMHGNLWEWTEDCWNGSYAGAPTDGSAWESGDCSRRVLRGGSWVSGPRYLRSAIRSGDNTGYRGSNSGVRVARTLTP